MAEEKVFSRLAFFVPAFMLLGSIPLVLSEYEVLTRVLQGAINIYIWIIVALMISSVLLSINKIYETYESSKNKPIKGYLLFIRIIVWFITAICIVAILIGKNPGSIFVGLGALSAVLLLVFKDPIMGLVGSVQLSSNDMLRIGDWISMPAHNTDGDVIDISLTTVKVQNWDKTISTIPTYSLISESFQNWRGMEESGGRRIKRSINIDMHSVKFCTQEMLDKFSNIQLLADFITEKQKELKEYNSKHNIDNSVVVNGRRQTNLGVFRTYLERYLNNLPFISEDMTFIVRQLQPGDNGIPMEIYVFSKVQAWVDYEGIQSDIFDHILAVIPEFELTVFQTPTGSDLRALKKA
jgi:miniconductance mechanosensitive channel